MWATRHVKVSGRTRGGTWGLLNACWDNLEDWIVGEINRLSAIFDVRGKRLVGESQTVPGAEGNA